MTKDPAKIKAQRRKYYLANREKQIADSILWHKNNREHWKQTRREYRRKLREAVLDKLGRKCARCPVNEPLVLQVDHVYGDGKRERESYSKGSTPAYLKKILADDTGTYQLLCANCNILKYHKEERSRYALDGRWDKLNINPSQKTG